MSMLVGQERASDSPSLRAHGQDFSSYPYTGIWCPVAESFQRNNSFSNLSSREYGKNLAGLDRKLNFKAACIWIISSTLVLLYGERIMHCGTPTFPLVIAGIPYSQGSQCHEENEVKALSRFPFIDDFHQLLTYLLTYLHNITLCINLNSLY